jgi:hypothetical protein
MKTQNQSAKQVRETKAGKSISAYVILRKNGTEVATVQAHFSDGGNCLVNVWNFGDGNPQAQDGLQRGTAGGYGYDKFTAALSGLKIDGHELTNHCDGRKKMPKGGWKRDAKPPKGWSFANCSRFTADGEPVSHESQDKEGDTAYWAYTSCYRESGLDYLKALGYRVIQAI